MQLISNDKTVGRNKIQVSKDFISQTLLTQVKKGKQLVP